MVKVLVMLVKTEHLKISLLEKYREFCGISPSTSPSPSL